MLADARLAPAAPRRRAAARRSRPRTRLTLAALLGGLGPARSGALEFEVPDDWLHGRTLYGGLSTALCSHAAQLIAQPEGELRALQIAFIAPATGAVRYQATLLRQGRAVTFVGVDCVAESGLAARAVLTYGRARPSEISAAGPRPAPVASAEHCPALPAVSGMPAYLAHMDLRFAAGTPPFSGGDVPAFAMWARHRDAAGVAPTTALLTIADALPPAVLAQVDLAAPHPASSITWTVDLAPPAQDPTAWYLLESHGDQSADGYSLEGMRCFSADGRLLAFGRQTVAVF